MHVDLRLQVGNFGVQHEFQNLRLSIFVPFFNESHPISVSGDARFNNRLESGVGKTPFQPATQRCLLTRIMHVDLRPQVGNFGDQHEFLNLQLSIFVPF
jgi:hypothetical protein